MNKKGKNTLRDKLTQNGPQKSEVKVGDNVQVRQQRRNKFMFHFNPTSYVVAKREHSRVTAHYLLCFTLQAHTEARMH